MKTYWQCAVAGTIAGMRSFSALSIVSSRMSKCRRDRLDASPLRFLVAPAIPKIMKVLAIGEMGGDKYPNAPRRIDPIPLAARAVSGSLSAAALCVADEESPAVGAVIGAISAVASSFLFYYARRAAGEKLKVPDALLGVSEDALVGALSLAITA